MTRPRTISLDEKTAIIARRIPNFSQWVRRKLIEHAREAYIPVGEDGVTDEPGHIAPLTARIWGPNKDKCNPRHRQGLCETCYGGDE